MDLRSYSPTAIAATSDDRGASPGPTAPTNRSKIGRAVVVLAIGAAVAYALSRHLRGSESIEADGVEVVPVVNDADDGADDAEQAEELEEAGGDTRENGDLDRETSVDVTEDDRSPEEIVERSREDVPEPGEMAVDDGVAEELLEESDEIDDVDEGGEETEDEGDVGDDGGAGDGDDSSVENDERPE